MLSKAAEPPRSEPEASEVPRHARRGCSLLAARRAARLRNCAWDHPLPRPNKTQARAEDSSREQSAGRPRPMGIAQRSKAQAATDVCILRDVTGLKALHLATRCAGGRAMSGGIPIGRSPTWG